MSNIIDFTKGKKNHERILAKKQSEKEAMIEHAKKVLNSHPQLPVIRPFEDYSFQEKIDTCIKQRWSLQVYIEYTSHVRANNRLIAYRPDDYKNHKHEEVIPYEQWVIERLSSLYPDQAKKAMVISITSD